MASLLAEIAMNTQVRSAFSFLRTLLAIAQKIYRIGQIADSLLAQGACYGNCFDENWFLKKYSRQICHFF
jgi:hypothetical protein